MPKRTRVSSPEVAEPAPGMWSNAIRVGDVLHVSGMTSRANDGATIQGANEYEQAKVIFAKIRHLVEAAGGTMGDVAKVTIYLTDIGKNTEVWRARDPGRDRGGGLHRLEPVSPSSARRLADAGCAPTRRAGSP